MSNAKKILDKMRTKPLDWKMEQLETVAKRYGITVRKSGGSHVVFEHKSWIEMLCVPARRPIKPIYIKHFVAYIERLEQHNESP